MQAVIEQRDQGKDVEKDELSMHLQQRRDCSEIIANLLFLET